MKKTTSQTVFQKVSFVSSLYTKKTKSSKYRNFSFQCRKYRDLSPEGASFPRNSLHFFVNFRCRKRRICTKITLLFLLNFGNNLNQVFIVRLLLFSVRLNEGFLRFCLLQFFQKFVAILVPHYSEDPQPR